MKHLLTTLIVTAAFATGMQAQTVFDDDFGDVSQFEAYTVVDQNHDGQTWRYDDFDLSAKCTRDYDADDWLITPAITLDATKTYKLTFEAYTEQGDAEDMAMMIGQRPTVAALQTALADPVVVSDMKPRAFTAIFTVATTGSHYIGLHLMTSGNPLSNSVYVSHVTVEETANQGVPVAVTDLTVTPAANSNTKAIVSFRTPDKNVGGGALEQLTTVTVWRDGTLVHTFDSPAMGTVLTFEDSGLASGRHVYRVVPANAYGDGEAAEQTVYVGADVPGPVQNLRFVYDYETRKAHLTWDAPTTGANGGYVDTEHLTYSVRRFHADNPVGTDLSEGSYEDEVDIDFLLQCEEETRKKYEATGMSINVNYVIDGQGLMQYYVRAISPAGKGTETRSNSVIIGEQNTLPYAESFANGQMTHFWRTDIATARQRWAAMRDDRFTQDEDGGMMGFTAAEGNETAMVHTGNISMKDAETPVLTFYYFYPYAMTNPLTIKVSKEGGDFETLATIPLSEQSQQARYLRASVPLTGCAGHDYVQVAFEVTSSTTVDLIYIDNVRIIDQRQYDLSVDIAAMPRNLKVGELRYLTAQVSNLGTADVTTGQYAVDVYVNGKKAGSTVGTAIGSEQQQNVMVLVQTTIDMQTSSQKTETASLYAEVTFAADEVPGNNCSEEQTITLKLPRYPEPTNVVCAVTPSSGEQGGGPCTLTWDVPAAPRTEDGQVTDGFEDYADFQRTNFGEWTLYDEDRLLTYGLGEPWHFTDNSKIHSYIIWNPSQVKNAETGKYGMTEAKWQPRTGEKCVASFGVSVDNCDDWLVSPELSGNAQVVSFYARHPAYGPERFQMYISTSGYETTNFMAFDTTPRNTTNEWTLYEYALPQGTKYFAIRKVTGTDESWALLIDDMTFAPDTLAAQPNLMHYGYNVYKNGTRVNTSLVMQPTFTDPNGSEGDVYRVTAVYNLGESVYAEATVIQAEANNGDVNNDGLVGIGDIVSITNVMAGAITSPDVKARADVNGDGEVGIGDIVAVTNIMAGK
jgi:hypothetical protein